MISLCLTISELHIYHSWFNVTSSISLGISQSRDRIVAIIAARLSAIATNAAALSSNGIPARAAACSCNGAATNSKGDATPSG